MSWTTRAPSCAHSATRNSVRRCSRTSSDRRRPNWRAARPRSAPSSSSGRPISRRRCATRASRSSASSPRWRPPTEAQLHQAEAAARRSHLGGGGDGPASRRGARDRARRPRRDARRPRPRAVRRSPASSACSRRTRSCSGRARRSRTLEKEIKERSAAVTQAHKEADEVRRSLAAAQADLVARRRRGRRGPHRARDWSASAPRPADQAATAAARERDALQERVDKLIRQLDDAAADNQEVNRRLQDFEARRQLELADDPGRTQIDELLRVTQERLAGQTEKLIATEDRVKELESGLTAAAERADLAEAENRTHQMSEALREMREHDVATTRDATTQREISAATSAAIDAGALEDRRATSPLLKELSMDAKKSLAKIDAITKLMKHKKDREGSDAADEAARHVHATPRPHGRRHRGRREPEQRDGRARDQAHRHGGAHQPRRRRVGGRRGQRHPCRRRRSEAPDRRLAYGTDHVRPPAHRQRANPERQDDRGPAAARRGRRDHLGRGPRGSLGRRDLTGRAPVRGDPGWLDQGGGPRRWRRRVPRVPARRGRYRRHRRPRSRSRSTSPRPRPGPSRTARSGRPRPRIRTLAAELRRVALQGDKKR